MPSSCRVSLLVGGAHQIDLVLPAAVPLSALTDSTLGAVNRLLRSKGEDELPVGTYEFARAVGMTRLSEEVSLSAQGVADGDLLAFVPEKTARRYTPLIENVSTALARWAHAHFPPVSTHDAVVVAGALTAAALLGAALLVWRLRWAAQPFWLSPAIFAVTAGILLATTMLSARAGASRVIVDGAAWAVLAGLVLAMTILFGVLTTGSGPHSGDADVLRHGFDATVLAHVHSWPGYILAGLVLFLTIAAWVLRLEPRRWLLVLVLAILVQVGVGVWQAREGLPPVLVGIHMVLAALSAATYTVVVLRLRRPVPAED